MSNESSLAAGSGTATPWHETYCTLLSVRLLSENPALVICAALWGLGLQAAYPGYGGMMVPHMGGYGFQPGYAYGHGGFGAQHMGGPSGYETQQQQQQQGLTLAQPQQVPPQGQPPYGGASSSRHYMHPRSAPGASLPCCGLGRSCCVLPTVSTF